MSDTPRPLSILFVITKSNWGGAQRYVYDLAVTLKNEGHSVAVALGGTGKLSTLLADSGVTVHHLKEMKNSLSPVSSLKAVRELIRLFKTERPDIIHLNSSVAGFVGGLAGRIVHAKKIIFTAHGWAFNEDRPLIIKIVFFFLHAATVLLAARTIAVSESIVQQMRFAFIQRRMKVIPPGRTIPHFLKRDAARAHITSLLQQKEIPPLHIWIGTIAELHPIKRFPIALSAIARLRLTFPHVHYVIIGDGTERESISGLIKAYGLEDYVHLTGAITEAATLLPAFDIFLLASKSESYGYVLHEAGLAGVPVVATNVGGIPTIVTDNHSGLLVPPDNSDTIVEACTRLLTDEITRTHFSQTLKQKVTARTVANMTKATLACYLSDENIIGHIADFGIPPHGHDNAESNKFSH